MNKTLISVMTVIIMLSLLITSSGSALAAPPEDKPGKGPGNFEKVVFVHYPKGQDAKGGIPGAPGGKDKPDDDGGGGKAWYKYGGVHWEDSSLPISYVIESSVSTAYSDAIQDAFQTWEDDPDSYIDFECVGTYTGLPSTLVGEGYMNYENEVAWAPISSLYPNAIAVTLVWRNIYTGIIGEVDMVMNSDLPWSQTYLPPEVDPDDVTGDIGSYDVQNIVTHEVGHWLMLEDLYNKPARNETMYGYGSKGELKKRSLEYGDISGLKTIYGGATAP